MKIKKFADNESWLSYRVGKVGGTRLGEIIDKTGKGKLKKGFWELIAERVATMPTGENVMDRGHRLEEEAIKRFEKETGKKVDSSLIVCISDEDENVYYSPDGVIGKTESVEVKCLNSASHIEALITGKIPNEYEFQKLQPFIVNPKLNTLYFCFYDPRIPNKDFFFYPVKRKDLLEDIKTYKAEQLRIIKEVEKITLDIVGF